MRQIRVPLGAAIIAALTACRTAPAAPEAPAAPVAPAAGAALQLSDTDRAAAKLAVEALASELGIAADEITVESVSAVDWRDSSLGCPKPDMAYLSVVTPGHRVTLLANGKLHSVHEANNRAFVCRQARPLVNRDPAGFDLTARKQMLQARKDLARRLSVPEADIELGTVTPTTWADTSLGCPEAGATIVQGDVSGWQLMLTYGERDFEYHADAQRVIPCPAIASQ